MLSQYRLSSLVFVIVLVFAPALLLRFIISRPRVLPYATTIVSFGDIHIVADLADTDAKRIQGLGGRTGLADDQGMLFVFDQSGLYSFWMKDMRFPLDIVWLDADKRVVYVQRDISPDSYPRSFVSTASARYVLEVNAGFTNRHHIGGGAQARF